MAPVANRSTVPFGKRIEFFYLAPYRFRVRALAERPFSFPQSRASFSRRRERSDRGSTLSGRESSRVSERRNAGAATLWVPPYAQGRQWRLLESLPEETKSDIAGRGGEICPAAG